MDELHLDNKQFLREKHVKYIQRIMYIMSSFCSTEDPIRLTILYFCLAGLDILDALDEIDDKHKKEICNWIYKHQILPDEDGNMDKCGFLGSSMLITSMDPQVEFCNKEYANGHITMTYTALASLLILGDDLSGINRQALVKGLQALQQEDGSFCGTLMGSERDMRFVYSACAISYILQDWSGINFDKTLGYIKNSFSYDGGIGLSPGLESHGGVLYCAVASLKLMGKLETVLTPEQIQRLKVWSLMRQNSGFQGRTNKPEDTCYSFWVGATLKILDFFDMVNFPANKAFILSTQAPLLGGMSKWEGYQSDPLHTYFGLAGLSLMEEEGLLPICPEVNITLRTFEHLRLIHQKWQSKTS